MGLFGKTFRTSPMNELRPSEWDPRLPPGGLPPHEGIEPAPLPVQTHGKWWWLKRSIQALLLLFAALIAWLARSSQKMKRMFGGPFGAAASVEAKRIDDRMRLNMTAV